MRWTYAQTPQELKAKQAKLDAIETFWSEFVGNMANIESYFSDTTSFDLPGFMQEQLAVVDERLVFEFGPAVHTKGHRLVITCELTETLSPMLDDMMAAAPKLGGWEFYTRRIAGPYDDVLFYIEGRSGVDVSQWRVRTSVEGRRIRLDFLAPDHRPEAEEHLWNACCVATEALLGDETMGAWIGGITVDKLKTGRRFFGLGPDRAAGSVSLADLSSEVTSHIRVLLDALPAKPYAVALNEPKDGPAGYVFELEPPPPDDDYPNHDDKMVASSLVPFFPDAIYGGAFFSSTLSRCGETFCYLKLDGTEGFDEKHVRDRGEVEDALSEQLEADGLGCTVGGATGLMYSYIEFALLDVDKGIDVIRRVLQGVNIHKRSWVLFHDVTQAEEWVGVYDDTPPPPGRG